MSERIHIFDTTLRDGEQAPGTTMSIQEKVQLARQLENLGVDTIEAGFPAASMGDFNAVQSIAQTLTTSHIAALSRCSVKEVQHTWNAIKAAKHPCLHTFIATSALHIEYKLQKSPQEVLSMITAAVTEASRLSPLVEFSAEDASRSNKEFLARAVDCAISAGARVINIPDTVGYAQPDEFGELIRYLLATVPNSGKAIFSVHCHNDLGLAIANTLAALKAGARQAEVTLCGIGERAGNASLEELAMALKTRENYYHFNTGIHHEQIFQSCRLLSKITGQQIPLNKAIVGANAFAHESGIHQDGILKKRETYEIMTPAEIGRTHTEIILGKHSGRKAVAMRLNELGYHLSDAEVESVFAALKRLADKKAQIFDEDVESLVLEEVFRIPDTYKLVHLSVQASDVGVPPSAAIVMEIHGVRHQHTAFGAGPIDALFLCISQLVKRTPELLDYSVNSITGGTDAMGEVVVKLREEHYTTIGRGAHPDIIFASAKAFVHALNLLEKKAEEENA